MNVLDSFSLKGRVAVLTGGAGLYGRQLVDALAEAGATTYIASRNVEALEAVAAECRERGQDVTALQVDQGDEASIHRLRDEIMERSGKLDILVNNAVARPMRGGWDDDAERFDESMHVNATGLFMMTRALGDPMKAAGSGSIINIGSMMGVVGVEPQNYDGTEMHGWFPDYFFHKGGMINFTRFCASYFGEAGVRVNCINPGGLNTPDQPQAFVEQYSARTQLGRMGNTTDLKGIIVFLASEASAYITGASIPVDGGYTAK
ncbi:MAG: SDR family NAD(P)-dependent oxidoreductase [Planctomycetota bacterium]|jgi:NAD(P)-dependent dehydrogenase (short-subunit alcohol dehydrogenase family)